MPRLQTPTPTVITAFFLRQVEANHIRTTSRCRPLPLHFDATIQSLSEWAWYVAMLHSTSSVTHWGF